MRETRSSGLMLVFSSIGCVGIAAFIYCLYEKERLLQHELELLKIEDTKRELEREQLCTELKAVLEQHAEVAEKILVEVQADQPASPATQELQQAVRAIQKVGFFSVSLPLDEKLDVAEQSMANFRKAYEATQKNQNEFKTTL